jgi:hypothetical protein
MVMGMFYLVFIFQIIPIFKSVSDEKFISAEEFRRLWEDPKETNQIFRNKLRKYPSKKCVKEIVGIHVLGNVLSFG